MNFDPAHVLRVTTCMWPPLTLLQHFLIFFIFVLLFQFGVVVLLLAAADGKRLLLNRSHTLKCVGV